MRVLVVDHDFPVNQLEINFFTYDEIMGLAKRGVELFVISANKVPSASLAGVLAWGLPTSISTTRLIKRIVKRRLWSLRHRSSTQMRRYGGEMRESLDMDLINDYRKIIEPKTKQHSIDLIHAQWPYPQGFAALSVCRSQGKPLVVTVRGGDLNVEPSLGYGHRLDRRKDASIREVLNYATKVLVPTHFMENLALEVGCQKEKVEYLPSGVDLTMFTPKANSTLVREAYRLGDRFVVLTMINDLRRPVKGLEYLLEAAAEVKKSHPDIIFLIAGSRLSHDIFKKAQDLSLQDSVIFVGSVPHLQTPFYIRASDMVVIPSLAEAMSITAVESMACEKPIVASDVGGLPEVVRDKETGFLVPAKDFQAIADRIRLLHDQPQLRKNMGKKAGVIARERFDIQNQISKVISVYEQILGSRS